ncbi:L-asparaginase [Klebsiella pneumoniae]|uniref:L-asparaginase n=1 Tax=Klebsiella pneumoniae TaxID=573 RepID=A0A377TQH9_KLEPN|nr:L-asparaginase [Klebsiella pneumoniae]
MQRSEHGYVPVSGHLQRQLALMPEFHRPEMPDFTIHEYHPLMDSSDMTPRGLAAHRRRYPQPL